jgi:hypothetical protein
MEEESAWLFKMLKPALQPKGEVKERGGGGDGRGEVAKKKKRCVGK